MFVISGLLILTVFSAIVHADINRYSSTESPSPEQTESDAFDAIPLVVSSNDHMTVLDIAIEKKEEIPHSSATPVSVGMVAVAPRGIIASDILSVQAYRLGDSTRIISLFPSDQPPDIVVLDTPAVWRELRVVTISVNPYFIHDGNMYELKSARIAIVNRGGAGESEKELPVRPISPMWVRIYESNVLNFDSLDIPLLRSGTGSRYIVISRHRFTYQIPQFVEWKTRQGYGVVHTTLEELGYSDPLLPEAIDATKRFIMEAYTSWQVPPEFVILVGDMFDATPSGSIYSKRFNDMIWYQDYDQWYALLGGPDLLPDVMLGRFPDTNVARLDYLFHKSINYEMYPHIEEEWQKNAVMTGAHHWDPNHVTIQTKREVSDSLAAWGMNVEERYHENAIPAMLIPLINQGLSFYNYRGDWCNFNDWGGTFFVDDVQYISNAHKLGIWTILSCYSADVGRSSRSIAEALLRHGHRDPSNPQGAVAFVGSQGNSWYLYNNALDKGFYRAFTTEGATLLGEALVSGKIWAYANTPPGDYKSIMMKEYTILGDPSLQVWTDVPRAISVTWDQNVIPPDIEVDVTVTVSDSASMEPIIDALVCLYRPDDVFVYAYTDDAGIVNLPVSAMSGSQDIPIDVTVTAVNGIPFFGHIPVSGSTQPHAPEVFEIRTNETGHIILSWSPVRGHSAEYCIYRVNTPYGAIDRASPLVATKATRCVLSSDTHNPTSFFRVVARTRDGVLSPPSRAVGLMRTDLRQRWSKSIIGTISDFLRENTRE